MIPLAGFTPIIRPAGGVASITSRLLGDFDFSSATLADVDDMILEAEASAEYWFRWQLIWQNTGISTTGLKLSINGPASPVLACASGRIHNTNTGASVPSTSWIDQAITGYGAVAQVSSSTQNVDLYAVVEGILRNGTTAGNLVLQAAVVTDGQPSTIKAGSFLTYRKYYPE